NAYDGGVLGATLLYHDDSIQHCGFRISDDATVEQPRKGLHKDLPVEPASIDAVSSACMMIDRDLFIAARGFAGGFVDGEFEDIDLCARVKAMGRSVRIVP